MIYRTLTIDDYKQFSALRQRGLENFPEAFTASEFEENMYRRSRYEDMMRDGTNFIMGAFQEMELCGMAGFVKEARYKVRHRGLIWGVYVDPVYQQKGIGLHLLQETVQRAFQIPMLRQIYVSTGATNEAAIKLYKNVGFKQYGHDPNAVYVDGQFMDQILMVLHKH